MPYSSLEDFIEAADTIGEVEYSDYKELRKGTRWKQQR
jgi:hypothetical protein